jgi:hypothetical protein
MLLLPVAVAVTVRQPHLLAVVVVVVVIALTCRAKTLGAASLPNLL